MSNRILTTEIKLTSKQLEAMELLTSNVTNIMLFGGSRSGKTFLLVRAVITRALKAPNSRHCILRFRFNHIKSSIVYDTFPKVMELCFPGIRYKLDKVDWFAKFENGAEIWFGGLDDKQRTEKILGNEYVTIYLNECSQISWLAVGMVVTRLAQKILQIIEGKEPTYLVPKMYFDCNPPNKLHWTYLIFKRKVDPDTKEPLLKEDNYLSLQMNPQDNAENLTDNYIETLDALPARLRRRFKDGDFADATPNALFNEEDIDKWRILDSEALPDFVRVVVAVDPSGADEDDNANNDDIGIAVVALGVDGVAYLLEDCTVKAGPATWGRVVAQAYDRHKADIVVGETNFGGAMVKQTIQIARRGTPFKAVTASRGKAVRAEPISALYAAGKVRHVGNFNKLEEELSGFTTFGYVGAKSPNRADAAIWGIHALLPNLTQPKEKEVDNSALMVPTFNPFAQRR